MASARSTIQIIIDATTRGLEAAAARARAAVAEIDDAANSASRPGSGLSTFTQVMIAAAPVLGALVGQALAAVPALFQLGAIAGTVVLGLQGIKNAAEPLMPVLGQLKLAVAGVFQQQLTPVFQKLAGVLPQLTSGFKEIAVAVSGMIAKLVGVVTSTQGIERLKTVLKGAADLTVGLGDGIASMFKSLLFASAQLTPQMLAFGRAIGGVLSDIGDAFANLAGDGVLQKAFAGLTDTISGIGVALKELITLLVKAGAAVGTDFGDSFRLLGDIFRALSPAFSDLAKITSGVLVGALQTFAGVAKALGPPLKSLLDVIVPLAPQIGHFVAALLLIKVGGGIISGVLRLVGALGGLRGVGLLGLAAGLAVVADKVNDLNTAASGGDPSKLGILPGTLDNIVQAGKQLASGDISGILADISSEVDQVGEAWTRGQTPIQQWFDKVKTSFQNDFVGVLTGIGDTVNQFITDVGTTIGNGVSTWFTGVKESFQRDFLDVFAALPGQIGAFFAQIPGVIASAASTLWQGFLSTVQANFAPVIAFFSQTPYQMGFAIGSAVGALVSAAVNLMTQFGNAVNQGITNVLTFFTNLPNQIAVALAQLGSSIVTSVVTAMTQFGDAVNQGITNVITFFTGLPGRAVSAVAPLPGQIVGVATQAGTGFLNTVTTWFNNAVAFVATIPGRALSAISAIIGNMINAATQAGRGFLSAITSAFNSVISFVAGIPGRIVSALGNMGSLLVGAGRAVIDGLLSGIRAGVQAMYDFVSGIAAGIAARKGPLPKDRVLLRPAGLAIMSGLLTGMQSGSAEVLAFASSMADRVARSSSTGLIASATSLTRSASSATGADAASGSALEQPITVNVMLSQEQIAGIAQVEIARRDRATKRTVLAGSGVTY